MRHRVVLGLYAASSLALWPVPLFNRLHAESSAVVAGVAFFVAGVASVRALRAGRGLRGVLGRQVAALAVPWALLTLPMLWAPNCGYAQGLMLFALFPIVTVPFAVALAYALTGGAWPRRKGLALVLVGLGVGLGGVAYDLGLHPQFYTYNHVFGGVLGPIYDEELAVRPGLFAFRAMTLAWAAVLVLVGRWRRGDRRRGVAAGLGAGLLALGTAYGFSAPLGINTPAWWIQRQLGGHLRTTHFDIYYDPDTLSDADLRRLASDHAFRYAWLRDRLDLRGATDEEGRIQSYLYPSPDVKASLTGARYTSVAPVWLLEPQAHVLLELYDATFAHELAHVVSRPFGLPGLNATWAVGLVEGWAVALEPPDGRPSPHEQVAVAALGRPGGLEALADDLAARLSPQGFWTGRGAVSYTTTGSFVRYLLDAYGPAPLKAAYARADFAGAYGKPLRALAREWVAFLADQAVVARSAEALVSQRFARPSLFEQRCPHYVPPPRRAVLRGRDAWASGDTSAARAAWAEALRLEPQYGVAHADLARLRLAQGEAEAVVAHLDTLGAEVRGPLLDVRLAQAFAATGEAEAARARYAAALARWPLYDDEGRARLHLLRLVADAPAVTQTLVGDDEATAQAARLADVLRDRALPDETAWAVRTWAALRWLEADVPAEARAAWNALAVAPPPTEALTPAARALLRDRGRVWRAQAAYRAGAFAEARHHAEAAARSLAAAGALNAAAAVRDLYARIRWAEARAPRGIGAMHTTRSLSGSVSVRG